MLMKGAARPKGTIARGLSIVKISCVTCLITLPEFASVNDYIENFPTLSYRAEMKILRISSDIIYPQ